MTMERPGSTVEAGGAEELAQEKSHRMDNKKSDDDCKPEEEVDERNL